MWAGSDGESLYSMEYPTRQMRERTQALPHTPVAREKDISLSFENLTVCIIHPPGRNIQPCDSRKAVGLYTRPCPSDRASPTQSGLKKCGVSTIPRSTRQAERHATFTQTISLCAHVHRTQRSHRTLQIRYGINANQS